jgi:hypothetical protein
MRKYNTPTMTCVKSVLKRDLQLVTGACNFNDPGYQVLLLSATEFMLILDLNT